MEKLKNPILLLIAAASVGIIGSRVELSASSFLRFAISASAVVSFAALMFWMLSSGTRKRLTSHGIPDGDYPIEVEAKLDVALNPPAAMSACIEAIRSLPNVVEEGIERSSGDRLTVNTIRTKYSWGEIVKIHVEGVRDGSLIEISSNPISTWISDDRAMNFQNVYLIVRILKSRFGARVFYSNANLES